MTDQEIKAYQENTKANKLKLKALIDRDVDECKSIKVTLHRCMSKSYISGFIVLKSNGPYHYHIKRVGYGWVVTKTRW